MFEVTALLVVLVVTVASSSAPTSPALSAGAPWLDTGDRDAVVAAYVQAFSIEIDPIEWDGDHRTCTPGSSSERSRRQTVERVNFYRAMAGVPAVVTEDATLSAGARAAALMMSAQGELTHNPSTDFACFTVAGQRGAANSNLYLGRTGPAAIDGYIEDPGDDNTDVGHRSTILHPPTRRMGVGDIEGSTDGYAANALWVFDDHVFDEGPGSSALPPMREEDRFVAWPPRGYVPATLVHPRWSFTRAGVDLRGAEVTLHRLLPDGTAETIPSTVVSRKGLPGHVPLPTLVWETDIGPPPDTDTDYLVVITGVAPTPWSPSGSVPVPVPVADPAPASAAVTPTVDDVPTVVAYTVRVMGRRPVAELTAGQFLARLGSTITP
ncbi:MAG: CAP domain-containing protein [Acidimicrobiales bacterium]